MAEETPASKLANPAILGLVCFGFTTVLLNLHNAGLYKLDPAIAAMGIFFGGIAQIIAGIMEYKKGNTFGTTAFCAYGSFWLTLVFIWIVGPMLSKHGNFTGFALSHATAIGWYLFLWGIFTGLMFVGTLKVNVGLQTVFATLTILYMLLAIHYWTGNATLLKVAGIEGIFCGASAIYLAFAELWNEMYGKVLLPIGAAKVEYKNPEDL